jgi:hypothetical protein
MAARRDSDAAWGRWFQVMGARPANDPGTTETKERHG